MVQHSINIMFKYIYKKIEGNIRNLITKQVGNAGYFFSEETGVYAELRQQREMLDALAGHMKVQFSKDCNIKVVPVKKSNKNK